MMRFVDNGRGRGLMFYCRPGKIVDVVVVRTDKDECELIARSIRRLELMSEFGH